jgi:hypothetical protein
MGDELIDDALSDLEDQQTVNALLIFLVNGPDGAS